MSLYSKNHYLHIHNSFHLHLYHFARGTYPFADGKMCALPVNRFLMPLDDSEFDGSYICDRKDHFNIKRGHIYFIPAHHAAGVKLTEKMRFISIQFLLDLHNGRDIFSSYKKILEIKDSSFMQRSDAIFDMQSAYSTGAALHSIVFEFIGILFDMIDENELDLDIHSDIFCAEMKQISEKCTATTTVAELAELCGVCRDTFSRTFTRKNGISPKQFLNRCILQRAYSILATEDIKIYETAQKLKFANEFYFSRFFKKHTGMSPKEFRQKHFRN